MSQLPQNLRLAIRMLWKRPLFTAVVVLTLAIGIGLNTAVFSVVHALLLRPLPGVAAPDRLVQVYRTFPGEQFGSLSIPDTYDIRERAAQAFRGLAGWTFATVSLSASDRPLTVMGQLVTANYFDVLGVRPAMGRVFTADEDQGPGAHQVVILSHNGWNDQFAADPDIIGREIVVNGRTMTVVGVTPQGFGGAMPMISPALWIPLMQLDHIRPDSAGSLTARGNSFMFGVGRLADGTDVRQAREQMAAVLTGLQADFPESYSTIGFNLVPVPEAGIHPTMRGAQLGLSAVVMGVVVMLLLIACVNVANLFLARARDRSREMAVRLAVGASRSALVKQLLTESILLAILAGAAGLLVASWVMGFANQIGAPVELDVRPDLELNPVVLLFTLGITLITGVLFGLAPALQASRPALIPALKGETAGSGGRWRATQGLVIAQMALSMVLLVCSGLFLVNLQSATTVDLGFTNRNVLLANVNPAMQGYTRERSEEFFRRLREDLQQNPAVQSVAYTTAPPLGLGSSDRGISIPGYAESPGERMSIHYSLVSPGYFETLGIPLLSGRDFTDRDRDGAMPTIIVNQRFAETYWPDRDPIGRIVKVGRSESGTDHTVVGVVPTGKYRSLGEPPLAYMFLAQAQHWSSSVSVLVRTATEPSAQIAALSAEVQDLDASMPLSTVRTMDQHLGFTLLPARLTGVTLGVFGIIGLALASIGMYGVMAQSVGQRTREIGLRIALGSTSGGVVRLVMRQGLALVLIGAGVGLAGAAGVSQLLRGLLYGEQAISPLVFAAVPIALLAVAAAAIWIPAHRASQLDPLVALRAD